MKLTHVLIGTLGMVVATLAIPGTASAAVLIDFQGVGGGTVDAPGPYHVVTLENVSGAQSFPGLTDPVTGGSIDLTVVSDSGFVPSTNSEGDPGGDFIDEAANDSARTTGETDGEITLTFSGLDDSLVYDIILFVNTNLFFTGDVDYSFAGAASNFTGVNTSDPQTLTWDGLAPSSGELVLTVQAHGSGNALARAAAVNAMSITEVPEPASLGLLALGGMMVLGGRRRPRAGRAA